MKHLIDIIRSAAPSSAVQFRRQPYGAAGARDFLRDLLALANADVEQNRYIIIGAEVDQNGQRTLHTIDKSDFSGKPPYPALAAEFVEPAVHLEYHPVLVDGQRLGVFEISACKDQPYMMRIDHSETLRRGDAYQRINNTTVKVGRRQLQAMFEAYFHETIPAASIEIGYPGDIIHKKYRVPTCDLNALPSTVAGAKLSQLIELKSGANRPAKGSTSLLARLTHARLFGSDDPYEDRPVEELQQELQQIEQEYCDHDNHFLFEQRAQELQLVIYNQSSDVISDASLAIVIPTHQDFFVATGLPRVPSNRKFVDRLAGETAGYPDVTLGDGATKVRVELGDVPPGEFVDVFARPLRVCAGDSLKGRRFGLRYVLRARNLRSSVTGKLRLIF